MRLFIHIFSVGGTHRHLWNSIYDSQLPAANYLLLTIPTANCSLTTAYCQMLSLYLVKRMCRYLFEGGGIDKYVFQKRVHSMSLIIRVDVGTENCWMAGVNSLLREDNNMNLRKTVFLQRTPLFNNKRIERWWQNVHLLV